MTHLRGKSSTLLLSHIATQSHTCQTPLDNHRNAWCNYTTVFSTCQPLTIPFWCVLDRYCFVCCIAFFTWQLKTWHLSLDYCIVMCSIIFRSWLFRTWQVWLDYGLVCVILLFPLDWFSCIAYTCVRVRTLYQGHRLTTCDNCMITVIHTWRQNRPRIQCIVG